MSLAPPTAALVTLAAALIVFQMAVPSGAQSSPVSPFGFKNLSNAVATGLTVDFTLPGDCRVLDALSPAFSSRLAQRRNVRLAGGRIGRREAVRIQIRHNCDATPTVDAWWWIDANGRRLSDRYRGPRNDEGGFAGVQEASEVLQKLAFVTPQGRIEVVLPLEVGYGDQVSGSLALAPAGDNDRETGRNLAALRSYNLDLAGAELPMTTGTWNRTLDSDNADNGVATGLVPIELWNQSGQMVAANSIPATTSTDATAEIQLPTLTQSGQPFRVVGPFDGDLSNTRIALGTTELEVLAESPRSLVALAPPTAGLLPLEIRDQGRSSEGPVRNVRVAMTTPRNSLAIGESVDLQFRVTGLAGLEAPLKVRVRNLSFGLVYFVNGERTPEVVIQPQQAAADGSYSFSLALQGTQGGTFGIATDISF